MDSIPERGDADGSKKAPVAKFPCCHGSRNDGTLSSTTVGTLCNILYGASTARERGRGGSSVQNMWVNRYRSGVTCYYWLSCKGFMRLPVQGLLLHLNTTRRTGTTSLHVVPAINGFIRTYQRAPLFKHVHVSIMSIANKICRSTSKENLRNNFHGQLRKLNDGARGTGPY